MTPSKGDDSARIEGSAASVRNQEEAPGLLGSRIIPAFTDRNAIELAQWDRVQEVVPPGEVLQAVPEKASGPSDVAAEVGPAITVDDGSGEVCCEEGCSNRLWCDVRSFCSACCQSGLIIGVEGTFLAPIGEPDQTVVLTDLTTGLTYAGSPDPSLGAGVRTWLGLQRNGWGIRFQYWTFGNTGLRLRPVVPVNAQPAFNEAFYLAANAIDVELTQRLCFGVWTIDTSFGGRHARLERNSTVVGYGVLGNGVNLYGLAMGANELEGSGFTFSVGGRRPLYDCYGWSAFWGYRGSLLWADSTASVLTEANAVTQDPPGSAYSRDMAFASKDHSEDVFISEIQLGIQYECCLACIPANFSFRAGMEYQHWNTGDVSAQSVSFAFLQGSAPEFGGRVDAASDAHDGDLGLIGFVLRAGLDY